MTDKPDLTPEQLDVLERKYKPQYPAVYIDTKTARALVAMAKRTEAAEHERDDLRETCNALMAVWLDVRAAVNGKPLTEIQAALTQHTDAGGA